MPRSIGYDSAKAILEYMNSNVRRQLVQRCIDLRTADKVTPIHISSLNLYQKTIQLDDTTYTIGIIQDYGSNECPDSNLESNKNGGIPYDVDQYGFSVAAEEGTYQHAIQSLEQVLQTIIFQLSRPDFVRDPQLKSRLASLEAQLLPYKLKRDNMKPLFSNLVQLKIETNESVEFRRRGYTEPIKNTMNEVVKKLLGGKKKPNVVDQLTVYENADLTSFPGKLRVRKLKNATNVLDKAAKIIDFERFPLESIELRKDSNYDHPMIKSAKILAITGSSSIASLTDIPNLRVHLECCFFSDRDIQTLITNCQTKKIGIHYTIGFMFKEDVRRFTIALEMSEDADVKKIADRGEFDNSFTFKMPNSLELVMFFEEANGQHTTYCQRGWVLNVRIQEKK